MKKASMAGLAIGMALGAVAAVAETEVTVGADVVSAYVWRGITLNDGVVFQPSLDVGRRGFGLNVWANLDIDDYDGALAAGEFSEIDFTLSYGFEHGPATFGLGYIEYTYPGGADGADRELYVESALDLGGGLSGGVTVYYHVDVKGFYASFGVDHTIAVGGAIDLETSVSVGVAEKSMTVVDKGAEHDSMGGFHDYDVSLTAACDLGGGARLGAFLAYAGGFSRSVLPSQDVGLYGGLRLEYGF